MVVADYGDLGALREVFVSKAYELDARCAPHFVLDLGAHIGAATAFFKLRYPNAVVHAVEPNPATFARLRANVAQFEGVTTAELAVAGQVGDRVLDIGHGSLDSMLQGAAPRRGARVTTATLDGLLSGLGWERVDVLKLDIEGAEEEVLAASRSLERVGAIVGEVHPARVHEEHFFSLLEGFAVTRGRRRVDGRTFVATRAAVHQAPD